MISWRSGEDMPRVAWFSPIADSKLLKSAAFTRRILPLLPPDWDVVVFVDDPDWLMLAEASEEPTLCEYPVYPFHRAYLEHAKKEFDLFIFQLEDRAECSFVAQMLPVWPGVAYFHDTSFNRLELSRVSHATTGEALNKRMKELYGDSAPRLGDWLEHGWSVDIVEQRYAQGTELFDGPTVVAVQSSHALQDVERRAAQSIAVTTAFPAEQIREREQSRMRASLCRSLGIDPATRVIGYAGRYSVEDRIPVVVEGVAALFEQEEQNPSVSEDLQFLWIVNDDEGEEKAEEWRERFAKKLPKFAENFLIVNPSDDTAFLNMLAVVDVMLGLRLEPFRGLPLSLIGAFSRGIPTIVSDFGPSAEIPIDVALKIPVGQGERYAVTHALRELLANEKLSVHLAAGARAYTEEVLAAEQVFADLAAIIEIHDQRLASVFDASERTLRAEREQLLAYVQQALSIERSMSVRGSEAPDCLDEVAREFSW